MKLSRYTTILDSLLRLTRNTVFEIDEAYTFIEVYQGMPGDLLMQKEAFIGRRIMDVVPPLHWERVKPFFDATLISGEKINFSYPSFEPNDDRWFSASLQYIKGATLILIFYCR